MHECQREKDLSRIEKNLDELIAIINGKDNSGLKGTVALHELRFKAMETTIKELSGNTKNLGTAINGLLRFMDRSEARSETEQAFADKKISSRRFSWTQVIALGALIVATLALIFK